MIAAGSTIGLTHRCVRDDVAWNDYRDMSPCWVCGRAVPRRVSPPMVNAHRCIDGGDLATLTRREGP